MITEEANARSIDKTIDEFRKQAERLQEQQ